MENNNMKEKLVELVQNARSQCNGTKRCEECSGYGKGDECVINMLADFLLANGVIVLLCKIGDTVYQVDSVRIYELEVIGISLVKGKPYYETESIDFDEDAIGKSIFLTREEAEMKLKEQ